MQGTRAATLKTAEQKGLQVLFTQLGQIAACSPIWVQKTERERSAVIKFNKTRSLKVKLPPVRVSAVTRSSEDRQAAAVFHLLHNSVFALGILINEWVQTFYVQKYIFSCWKHWILYILGAQWQLSTNPTSFQLSNAPSILGAVSYMSLFISKLKMSNSVTPSQMLPQATELGWKVIKELCLHDT